MLILISFILYYLAAGVVLAGILMTREDFKEQMKGEPYQVVMFVLALLGLGWPAVLLILIVSYFKKPPMSME